MSICRVNLRRHSFTLRDRQRLAAPNSSVCLGVGAPPSKPSRHRPSNRSQTYLDFDKGYLPRVHGDQKGR